MSRIVPDTGIGDYLSMQDLTIWLGKPDSCPGNINTVIYNQALGGTGQTPCVIGIKVYM